MNNTRQGVAEPASSQDTQAPHRAIPILDRLLDEAETMYPAEYTQTGISKHSRHCQAMFNRRDWNCHRCVELMLGAAPRNGWQHEYFARKLRQRQRSFTW